MSRRELRPGRTITVTRRPASSSSRVIRSSSTRMTGDYVFVPPYVPHIEENPSPNEEAVIIVARSTQEAIVENLERL
jgi:uncharacterized RmlC-like cupin family protein